MPMNDICFLYQKAPEKVVDIVKQVSDCTSFLLIIYIHKPRLLLISLSSSKYTTHPYLSQTVSIFSNICSTSIFFVFVCDYAVLCNYLNKFEYETTGENV